MSEIVTAARHRLEVLARDTTYPDQRETRTVRHEEALALRTVLDELHRLNVAVSEQRTKLEALENERAIRKALNRKPAAARSQPATTHSQPKTNSTAGQPQPRSAPRPRKDGTRNDPTHHEPRADPG